MKNYTPSIVFCLFALSGSSFAVDAPTSGAVSAAGPKTIALQWTDASTDETGFEIERHNGDNNWAALVTPNASTTHYYDRAGLTEQTTWHYRVRSVENANSSSWLDLGSATTTITMNILFFFSDDMGYKDIVAHRNETIDGPTIHETPTVDTLVSEGLTINNAYCSGPRCVVARRCVQLGKYDWRPEGVPTNKFYIDHDGVKIGGGIYAGGITVAGSESGAGVTIANNVTYAEAVKTAGYRTCFIGKYHLGESPGSLNTPTGYSFGDQPGRGPIAQGYDVSIASGHAGAPPASYFALENLNAGAGGAYTFELPDLDDTNYMLTPAAPVSGDYITDRLTDKAIGFMDDVITNHSSQPFHITLAHYAVHTPVECKSNAQDSDGKGHEYFQTKKASMASEFAAHPAGASALITDYTTKTRVWQDNPVYAGMMKSYDDSLSELRTYLAATDDPRYPGKKLSETTIIVLTSDHGGKSTTPIADNKSVEAANGSDTVNPTPTYVSADNAYKAGTPNNYSFYPTSNYPYRQGKTWVYEGGLKVPLVIYFPGVTTAGSQSDAFVHHADLFASFCDMAGAAQQPTESTDSKSFLLTCGQPESTARNELHHFFTNANKGTGNPALAAYRKGDYKLIYYIVQRKVELYNLAADPYERVDLSSSRPDLAQEMLEEVYQQAISTGLKMPKPGSGTWNTEQNDVLIRNGIIGSLPAVPDASPSWTGAGGTQTSTTTIKLNWTANASNSTHAVVYRRADAEGETSYREHAFLPVGTTTFSDYNLIQGGQYRYRIESENLGGWAAGNTGNKTITLSDPGPGDLTITATDDTITAVPGKTRAFNPLLNDEGEGELTITAITQPSIGSATLTGKWISFQTPEDFSGSVTMTYTITDDAAQTDTATVTINLPTSNTSTVAREAWDFETDANSTDLNDLNNSGSLNSSWNFNTADATNGAGEFVLVGDSGTTTRKLPQKGTANALPTTDFYATPITAGKYRLEVEFASWNIDAASAGDSWKLDAKNSSGSTIARIDLVLNATEVHFTFTDDGGNTQDSANFSLVEAAPITAAIDFDFDANTIDYLVNDVVIHTFAFNAVDLGQFVYGKSGAWTTAASSANIEHIMFTEEVPGSDLYEQWASAYAWNGILTRDGDDDPDNDGIENIIEFAFGLPPTVPNSQADLGIALSADGSTLGFTPFRDTSLLNYLVEFSDDLSIWDSYTPFTVATPAGQAVDVNLPTADRIFTRVNISSQ